MPSPTIFSGLEYGTTVKVRLQTRRDDTVGTTTGYSYSVDSEVKSVTVDTDTPDTPLGGAIMPGDLDLDAGSP